MQATDIVSIQFIDGCLDEDSCVVVIKVKQDYIISNKSSILKHYLQPKDFNQDQHYAENLDYSIQEHFGLPQNVDWISWLQEYPFTEIENVLREGRVDEVLFSHDADILKIEQIFLEDKNICFRVRCGFNHTAEKFGTMAERIAGILLRTFEEMDGDQKEG